jgi:ribonuclease HI
MGILGNSTNNATEFGALETGLEILNREGMRNAIVEGDCALVINIVRKIQTCTRIGKIQRHIGLPTEKHPVAVADRDHYGFVVGDKVIKCTGEQNRK